MFKCIIIFLIPLIYGNIYFEDNFDPSNQIIGSPIIQCTPEKVKFSIETLKPFYGKIYVKGEFNKKQCGRSFSSNPHDEYYGSEYKEQINEENSFLGISQLIKKNNNFEYNVFQPDKLTDSNQPLIFNKVKHTYPPMGDGYYSRSFGRAKECPIVCPICEACNCGGRNRRSTSYWNDLVIPINECFSKRNSQIEPAAETVVFNVIVTFHKNFITKLDKSYQIICAYPEISRTVDTQIDVSAPKAKDISIIVNPPKCSYSLKDKNHNLVRHVNIGDEIIHEWNCESESKDVYVMVVKNCYVEDGNGRKELVIDDRGCSLDDNVLKTPVYSDNRLKAVVKSYVFKFPDRQYVDFQCSISICANHEQDCSNISPPICDDSVRRHKRNILNESEINTLDIHLHSQTLTVLETNKRLNAEPPEALPLEFSKINDFPVELCISFISFGLLIASGTFLFTVLSMTIVTLKFFKYFI